MAIRPTDLSLSIASQVQTPPLAQHAEEAPRTAQAATQALFAAQTEPVAETSVDPGEPPHLIDFTA